jgi:hypothetical protein
LFVGQHVGITGANTARGPGRGPCPGAAKPPEPSRWRGGPAGLEKFDPASVATEFHALSACMLEREMQLSNVRAIISMEGFGLLTKFLNTITPQELVAAAGEDGKRGMSGAMRSADVASHVKQVLVYMSMAGKTIPTTPAERLLQGRKALAQMVVYGPWVLFSTANFDPLGNPIFAMLVVGPGEGGLVREPISRVDESAPDRDRPVRLSDERPATADAIRLHRHFARAWMVKCYRSR